MIADAYKNSLKNKTADYFNSKYNNLKSNETLFQKLLVKSKLVKDFKIKKNRYIRWSEKEFALLVLSVMKYGSRWDLSLNLLNQYFRRGRSIMDI
jgi:hypothetical protein